MREINKESENVDNFADGVASIHLVNAEKHIIAGDILNRGKKKYSDGSSFSTSTCNFFETNLSWKWLTLIYCIYKIIY